jgi:hypothetical protein
MTNRQSLRGKSLLNFCQQAKALIEEHRFVFQVDCRKQEVIGYFLFARQPSRIHGRWECRPQSAGGVAQ